MTRVTPIGGFQPQQSRFAATGSAATHRSSNRFAASGHESPLEEADKIILPEDSPLNFQGEFGERVKDGFVRMFRMMLRPRTWIVHFGLLPIHAGGAVGSAGIGLLFTLPLHLLYAGKHFAEGFFNVSSITIPRVIGLPKCSPSGATSTYGYGVSLKGELKEAGLFEGWFNKDTYLNIWDLIRQQMKDPPSES